MTTESTDKKIKLHPEVQERLDNAHQKKLNELAANPFVQFVTRYKNHPVLFVKEVLNTSPDEWQCTFLNHIAAGNRRISVRSGHGVGKSTAASWAIIWYLLLRYPVKVVVTAPTSSQLYDALFAELKRWVKELPPTLRDMLEVKQDRIEVKARAGLPISETMAQLKRRRRETGLGVGVLRMNGQGEKAIGDWVAILTFDDLIHLLKAAGGDPSILGQLADVTSTAFTDTPTVDTQKKIEINHTQAN